MKVISCVVEKVRALQGQGTKVAWRQARADIVYYFWIINSSVLKVAPARGGGNFA